MVSGSVPCAATTSVNIVEFKQERIQKKDYSKKGTNTLLGIFHEIGQALAVRHHSREDNSMNESRDPVAKEAQDLLPGFSPDLGHHQRRQEPMRSADFFLCTSDVVICPAEGSGMEITIKRAREDYHYRAGNMDGGEENIVRPENTHACNLCTKCIS